MKRSTAIPGKPFTFLALARLSRRINVALIDGGLQEAQEAEEAKVAKTPEGKFYPGPNGPRFTQDSNGWKNGKRKRAVVRARLARKALLDLASPDVRFLARAKTNLDVRQGYIRAALDHYERRQAEADQEAENQKRGDHGPVFLEARPITGCVDIKERKGREPPRLLPDHCPSLASGTPTATTTAGRAI